MAAYETRLRPTAPTPTYYSNPMAGPSHSHQHHPISYHHPQSLTQTSPAPSSPSPPPFYSQPSSPTEMYSVSHHEHAHPHVPGPTKPRLQHTTSLKTKGLNGGGGGGRPRIPHKKPSCSTRDKSRDVQSSLEKQVEKAKGFHAFFVPLGKSLPAAPPSSPVLGGQGHGRQEVVGAKDYFEDWVEDIRGKMGGGTPHGHGHESGMDID